MAAATVSRGPKRERERSAGLSDADRRFYESIPPEMGFMPHPDFALPGTEEKLFGPDAEVIPVPRWRPYAELDDPEATPSPARTRLTPHHERLLFMRYNYARRRLAELLAAQKRRFAAGRARQLVRWYRRVLGIRAALVGANMALVVAMAKRTRINSVEFGELVSEGNMALLRTVEKFDVSRGFKFSTYSCRAILKALNRLASKTGTYRQHFPTEYDPQLERSDEIERRHVDQRELALEDLERILEENMASLTAVERAVIAARYAVAGHDRVQTLQEVGRLVGLSKERVRQVQLDALAKLRAALASRAA